MKLVAENSRDRTVCCPDAVVPTVKPIFDHRTCPRRPGKSGSLSAAAQVPARPARHPLRGLNKSNILDRGWIRAGNSDAYQLENSPANRNRGRGWLCSYVPSTARRWTWQWRRSRAPWVLDRLAPHPRSFKRHWYDLALARAPSPAPKLGRFRGLRLGTAPFAPISNFW